MLFRSGSITALSGVTLNGPVTLSGVGTDVLPGIGGALLAGAAVTLNGEVYHTGGSQTYQGAVTLGNELSIKTANSPVTFDSTVNGWSALYVDSGSASTTFNGEAGGTTALHSLYLQGTGPTILGSAIVDEVLEVRGSVTLRGDTYSSNLSQTYTGAVTLEADVSFTTDGSEVVFYSTLNSDDVARSVTINTVSGDVELLGTVGGVSRLEIGRAHV